MAVDIDSVLEAIGEFGWYQKKIYFLLCLPLIFVGAANLSYTFIAASPNYRCYIPGCDKPMKDGPIYHNDTFLKFTIPINEKTNKLEMCYEYDRKNTKSLACDKDDFNTNIKHCQYGYVFDKSIYESTIVTEFNLTCSNSWKYKADQSFYFAGMLVGALLFGLLSDCIGRRITIMIGFIFMATSGIMIALIPNLMLFHVMRFINALSTAGVFQTAFILGLEFVGPRKRVMVGMMGQYFFCIGEILLGSLAYFFRTWRMLQLLLSVPVTIFGFYYWVVPESIRWLQTKGHHAKVVSQLEIIAKTNKTTIPLHLLRHQDTDDDTDDDFAVLLTNHQNVNLCDVVKSCTLSIRTVAMMIIWVTTTLAFYGISFTAVDLGGAMNPYTNFILSAVAEFPGYSIAWLGMNYIGRRLSLFFSLLLSGLACFGVAYLTNSTAIILANFFIGKCFITSAFAIIFIYTAEMYPTSVRNTIIGLCSMMARIGGMSAPFVATASTWYPPLPMIIFGSCSIASSFLTVVFPETLNSKLPDTLSQAINIGRRDTRPSGPLNTEESLYVEDRASLLENDSDAGDSDVQLVT